MDVFSPASRNKKKQERSGNVFSPTPRNWRELGRPGNIFTLTLKIKTVSKSGRLYQPSSLKQERAGEFGECF